MPVELGVEFLNSCGEITLRIHTSVLPLFNVVLRYAPLFCSLQKQPVVLPSKPLNTYNPYLREEDWFPPSSSETHPFNFNVKETVSSSSVNLYKHSTVHLTSL